MPILCHYHRVRKILNFINLANRLADKVRPIARQYFRQPLEIISKYDDSPVTIADRNCELAMREMIEQEFPNHGIYGEEYGVVRKDAEFVWVLDPIDGTAAFITGMPVFGTLIALCQNSKPILGIIDQPILKERWLGCKGIATTLNGVNIHVSDCDNIKNAALYITTPDMLTNDYECQAFENVKNNVKMTRYGGDCYSYGLLAAGHVDLIVESQLQPYDFLALVGVVENAGGVISDWQGNMLDINSKNQVVAAATPALHAQALGLLNS